MAVRSHYDAIKRHLDHPPFEYACTPGRWTGDLPPGDLPTWIPHTDEDTPGPVGEPIPPDQWTADELARMVAVEVEARERAGAGCWVLLADHEFHAQ